jgi:antitoxin VapB
MTSSKVFTGNLDQVVHLPEAVAFPAHVNRVDVLKIGRSRVIVPQNGPRERGLYGGAQPAHTAFIR